MNCVATHYPFYPFVELLYLLDEHGRRNTPNIAAILIVVSIEALLLMFKSALGVMHEMIEAGWMMFAAVGVLVGLGLFVSLGAQAEALLAAPPPRQ